MSELRSCLRAVVGMEETEEEEKKEEIQFQAGRILLAEDNELNQEIAVEILQEEGFMMDVADDGMVAVEKLKEAVPGQYDLVLMDIQMPILNGYEATKQIRALNKPGISDIPIIAMTANAFDEDKKAALEAGMNGHIAKPIDTVVLFQTLDQVLN